MTVETFLTVLMTCAIVTSLMTEAVKMFLDSIKVKYISNVVVLAVSVLVGGIVGTIYSMFIEEFQLNNQLIFTAIMIVANWLVAMLGYDKIIQTITQFKSKADELK